MNVKPLLSKIDDFQQSHPALAFPTAVMKRYGDDQTGKQSALITYYAFLSLFPLLLVFITFLGITIVNNPELSGKISAQLFQYFPALGSDLQNSVHSITGSGLALVLELLVLFYGARGLAVMLQDAFNHVWRVDKKHKAGFVSENLRSFGMMLIVGLGIIAGGTLSYLLGSFIDLGPLGSVAVTLVNAVVICSLFLVVFRLGTSKTIPLSSLVLGAVISGIGLLIIQHFGGYILASQLKKLTGTYGSFAIALGMLFWLYLQAQVIMYALTATAVKVEHDWPKRFFDSK